MSWTLCTSGVAITKAGSNVNESVISGVLGYLADYSDLAEGMFCMKTRKDWITNPPSNLISGAIADAVSDLIAIKAINYDQSGYLKGEAQTMLDVLKDNSDTIITDLREDKNQELNK